MKKIFLFLTCLILCVPAATAGYSTKDTGGIEVVVHRGANYLAPENTVASAYAALDNGATWIEVDVRSSKDGVLYNMHDPTLDRTTNGKGLISDMMSADIDKLDAGSWFRKRMCRRSSCRQPAPHRQ